MSQNTRRICFVLPSLEIGGTERQVLRMMKGLQDEYEFLVLCTRREGTMAGDARRLGVVKVLNVRGGWDIRMRRRVEKELRRYNPEIVHSFMFGFDHQVNVAARNAGIPVILSSRRQLATWKKPRHLRLQRRANKLVDGIVTNSHAVARFAAEQESAPESLFHVIHNGIDLATFQSNADTTQVRKRFNIPAFRTIIGIVANFSPVKDHDLFLEIVDRLTARRPEAHFLTVGNGPLRERFERALARRGLADRVTSIKTLAELPDVYKLMSISVLCSKVEGFPNAVLESMATGTPVVAANVGGIPELIEDGVTGTLVSGRDPEPFAAAIETLMDIPDECRAMGERAKQRVQEQFSLDTMVSEYKALYERCWAQAGSK